MTQADLATLFTEIDSLLRTQREPPVPDTSRLQREVPDAASVYWGNQPRISVQEMRMLHALTRGPMRADGISACLGRDEIETVRFLAALEAIGLVQHEGDRYGVTDTTLAYLQLFLQW